MYFALTYEFLEDFRNDFSKFHQIQKKTTLYPGSGAVLENSINIIISMFSLCDSDATYRFQICLVCLR